MNCCWFDTGLSCSRTTEESSESKSERHAIRPQHNDTPSTLLQSQTSGSLHYNRESSGSLLPSSSLSLTVVYSNEGDKVTIPVHPSMTARDVIAAVMSRIDDTRTNDLTSYGLYTLDQMLLGPAMTMSDFLAKNDSATAVLVPDDAESDTSLGVSRSGLTQISERVRAIDDSLSASSTSNAAVMLASPIKQLPNSSPAAFRAAASPSNHDRTHTLSTATTATTTTLAAAAAAAVASTSATQAAGSGAVVDAGGGASAAAKGGGLAAVVIVEDSTSSLTAKTATNSVTSLATHSLPTNSHQPTASSVHASTAIIEAADAMDSASEQLDADHLPLLQPRARPRPLDSTPVL